MDHVRACTGRYGEAWTGMNRTLRWLENTRQTRYQLIACDLMGHLLIDLGLNRETVELSERALARARPSRITFWRPRIEANLAIASIRLGRRDVGPLLENALRHARDNREGTQLVRCLEGLAELALARGDAAACLRHADELLSAAQRGGLKELAAHARRWRGEALAAAGAHPAAATELALAAAAAGEVGRVRLALDAARALEPLDPGGGHGARAQALAARIREAVAGTDLKPAV
jgi:hypothetical protein